MKKQRITKEKIKKEQNQFKTLFRGGSIVEKQAKQSIIFLAALTIPLASLLVTAKAQAHTTVNYGNVTLKDTTKFDSLHFNDVWDLTSKNLVLSYNIDMTNIAQTSASETPFVEVGLRQVGAADFNPGPFNTYQGGKGGWMTSLVGDLATNPVSLDLDDKHNLSASGGRGEGDYDVFASSPTTVQSPPIGSNDSRGIWFDRDGVDPFQNADTANTNGTYDIEIIYRAIDDGLGTMIANINGNGTDVSQQFRNGGTYSESAGLSFKGDMTQMQVFAGSFWTSGAAGDIILSDIEANGSIVPAPGALLLGGIGAGFAGLFKRRKQL